MIINKAMPQEEKTSILLGEPMESSWELLTRYLPWVQNANLVITTLSIIGLDRKQISRVLSGEEVEIIGELVHPDNGRRLLVPSVKVGMKVSSNLKECSVTIDGKGYRTFFEEWYTRQAYLERAAGQEEAVEELFRENLELRRMLGGIGRKYK